jgi:hypothetical protein
MEGEQWLLAFRYEDMRRAGDAYRVCRDLVFDWDIDASAYRIQFNTVPHVVVIGDAELLPALREMVERACVYGEGAELPEDIVRALYERRMTGKIPSAFWERRSQ